MSKHFCGGKLISTALFAEAVPCSQSNVMKDCSLHEAIPASEEDSMSGKNCCDTETTFVKVVNEQLEVSLELDVKDYPALFATLVIIIGLVPVENDIKTTNYLTYKPPLLVYNLPVSLQTFLI